MKNGSGHCQAGGPGRVLCWGPWGVGVAESHPASSSLCVRKAAACGGLAFLQEPEGGLWVPRVHFEEAARWGWDPADPTLGRLSSRSSLEAGGEEAAGLLGLSPGSKVTLPEAGSVAGSLGPLAGWPLTPLAGGIPPQCPPTTGRIFQLP